MEKSNFGLMHTDVQNIFYTYCATNEAEDKYYYGQTVGSLNTAVFQFCKQRDESQMWLTACQACLVRQKERKISYEKQNSSPFCVGPMDHVRKAGSQRFHSGPQSILQMFQVQNLNYILFWFFKVPYFVVLYFFFFPMSRSKMRKLCCFIINEYLVFLLTRV